MSAVFLDLMAHARREAPRPTSTYTRQPNPNPHQSAPDVEMVEYDSEVAQARAFMMAGTNKTIGEHLDEFDSFRDPNGRTFDDIVAKSVDRMNYPNVSGVLRSPPPFSAPFDPKIAAMLGPTIHENSPAKVEKVASPGSSQVFLEQSAKKFPTSPSNSSLASASLSIPTSRQSAATSRRPSPLRNEVTDTNDATESGGLATQTAPATASSKIPDGLTVDEELEKINSDMLRQHLEVVVVGGRKIKRKKNARKLYANLSDKHLGKEVLQEEETGEATEGMSGITPTSPHDTDLRGHDDFFPLSNPSTIGTPLLLNETVPPLVDINMTAEPSAEAAAIFTSFTSVDVPMTNNPQITNDGGAMEQFPTEPKPTTKRKTQ